MDQHTAELDFCPWRSCSRGRRRQRADRASGRLSAIVAYLVAGIVIGPFGLAYSDAGKHPHRRRTRRRDAAVPDRARTGALAPARDAPRHFRPRRRAARRSPRRRSARSPMRPACSTGAAHSSRASRSRSRRPRSRCTFSRSAAICSAIYGQRAFAILLFQDIVGRAIAGAACRCWRRARRARRTTLCRDADVGRLVAGAIAALVARRPLSAQSVLPPARLRPARAR